MLKNRLKDILKDSSIYGISKILGQVISFFLIPLYTSYLNPSDYGVLTMIGIMTSSMSLLMTFGIDSSTYRFVGLSKAQEDQKQYSSTAQLITLMTSLVIISVALIFIDKLNVLFVSKNSDIVFLIIGLCIAFFDTSSTIPRAYLRIKRKPNLIAIASLINILTSILFTILLVVVLKLGIIGALIGNLSGSICSSLFLIFKSKISNIHGFSKVKSTELIKYSLPVLPSQIFAFLIPIYSQWSLKNYFTLDQLGIYSIALKFTIPISVLLSMFQQAYAPYKFEIFNKDEHPQKTFSEILNMFVLFFGTILLIIAFYGGYLLKFMTNSSFHEAANYIFYIALIPLAQGLYFMFGTGVEFAKNPIFRPIISAAGLLTVILLNKFCIDHWGVAGAAISIVFGWLVMGVLLFLYSQQLYKISYQWWLIVPFLFLVVFFSYSFNEINNQNIIKKIGITLSIILFVAYYMNGKLNTLKIKK
jgi:O-antigen/teichoic acid export membrane protein